MSKRKFLRVILLLFIVFAIGVFVGKSCFPKTITIEKPIFVEKVLEYDNPALIEKSIKEVSQEYGIEEKVFWAIIKCEGGSVFAWNKTSDGGLFQINWETAKRYGAKSLKDLIDPRLSTKLTAEIIEKEGLNPWKATRDCIEREIIFTNLKVKNEK